MLCKYHGGTGDWWWDCPLCKEIHKKNGVWSCEGCVLRRGEMGNCEDFANELDIHFESPDILSMLLQIRYYLTGSFGKRVK